LESELNRLSSQKSWN